VLNTQNDAPESANRKISTKNQLLLHAKTKNAADLMVSGVLEIPLGKSAYAASAPFA
jgi:hypothetical protein